MTLLRKGLGPVEVARRVGATYTSVYRWQQAVSVDGDEALKAKPASGRPCLLGAKDRRKLLKILLADAQTYGYPNQLWTLKRIAAVIRREFGVAYHPNHVWRVLRGEGWSCQVPDRRAIQRDEKAIAHWKRYRWPAIKKTPKTWGPSGFH
jgi:transposase